MTLHTEALELSAPDDAQPDLQVARFPGGAWRAFVHVNSKFASLTTASIRDLASKYRQLTPEEQQYYTELGLLARDASRAGGITFPCWSRTAAWKRNGQRLHRQALEQEGHDRVDAQMKHLARGARVARRQEAVEKQKQLQALADFSDKAVNTLHNSKRLLDSTDDSKKLLFGFPHPHPAFQIFVDLQQQTSEELDQHGSILGLSNTWEKQHVGIMPESDFHIAKSMPVPRCLRFRSCWCEPRMKTAVAMTQKATMCLKALFGLHNLDEQLMQGLLVVQWVQFMESQADGESEEGVTKYTHISLQYKKPWRSTLLELECSCAATGENNMEMKVCQVDGLPAFRSIEDIVLQLDPESKWFMRLCLLSDHSIPCRPLSGQVYIKVLETHKQVFWRGASLEKHKRTRVMDRQDDIHQLKHKERKTRTFDNDRKHKDIPDNADPFSAELTQFLPGADLDTIPLLVDDHEEDELDEHGNESADEELQLQDLCGEVQEGEVAVLEQATSADHLQPPPVSTRRTSDHSSSSGRSSRSSSSSSGSSSSCKQGEQQRKPVRKENAPADFRVLKTFKVGGKFTVTPKAPIASGGSGGPHGGYSGSCPFHKKSSKTGCKKWVPLLGPTEKHRQEALKRLTLWLLEGEQFSRQRLHLAHPLVHNVEDLPTNHELHQRVTDCNPPEEKPLDDETLDAREGMEHDRPKRVHTKRLARPKPAA
eukprot:6490434-Amphidinium_carterae.9